jgi:hypothetical protein
MSTLPMSVFLADTTAFLARTPRVLEALLLGLPDSWTGTPDTPEGWRPHDVVGHLITGEAYDWMARTRLILEHGTSRPFDPFDRLAMVERDAGKTLDTLVAEFGRLRAANLDAIASLGLTESDLDRVGLHPALGEVTLRNLLASWSIHDLDHVSQIYAGLAGSHDAAVGAWKAYLGILLRRDDPSAQPG